MKVSELIQDLLLANPDAEVLFPSVDDGYTQLAADPFDPAWYDENGEVHLDAWSDQWGTPPNAIVLWPAV